MDDQCFRRSSFLNRDIVSRRNSVDEYFDEVRLGRNSIGNNDTFKNLYSLIWQSKAAHPVAFPLPH